MGRRPCKHIIKDIESIICPYCNISGFKMLHWRHLKKLHNKTLDDVLIDFPGYPTMTKKESNRRSLDRIKCDEKINKTCNYRYGGVGYKSKILDEKSKQTTFKKFGSDNIMKLEKYKDLYRGENGVLSNPERRKKISNALKGKPSKLKGRKYIEIHGPEKTKKLIEDKKISGAIACSKMSNPSKPQVELYIMVKRLFNNAELNYPFSFYCLDIVIPDKRICIEYDGSYWHQDKEKDYKRQKDLERFGWKFIRYIDYIPTEEELKKDVQKINPV